MNKKVIILELDGGSWEIIRPLVNKGKLLNLAGLMDKGCSSELVSVLPAISPKIWTSIFAGKTPEKTGIDFFGGNSKMVRCKRLWDIFSDKGLNVGIFGSFVTWPPYQINGFMIPAVDSMGTETYPLEYQFFQEIALHERKKNKGIGSVSLPAFNMLQYVCKFMTNGAKLTTFLRIINYYLQQQLLRFKPADKYWRKLILHSELSSDLFIHLYKRYQPNFATIHMHLCDSISHRYWMAYEPEKFPGISRDIVTRYKDVIPRSYIQADKAIGKILAAVGKDINVFVVSDHGFKGVSGGMNPYDINIEKFLEVLNIRDKVIVARFGPGMYLNFQKENLMQDIFRTVSQACLKETGDKVFNVRAYDKTLIVTKPNWKMDVKKLRDQALTVEFGKFGSYKLEEIYIRQKRQMSGVHQKEGILIMAGPNIRKGVQLEPASIYDVAPTVLHLMGFPVARDMDGKVLTEAFDEQFTAGTPVNNIETYETEVREAQELEVINYNKIEERLKSLGYL